MLVSTFSLCAKFVLKNLHILLILQILLKMENELELKTEKQR